MKLNYRTLGVGHPLIILHGLLGSLDNWVPVARRLAARFQIFLPDLRNHGQSPHAPDFDYDLMAEDVHEFLGDHDMVEAHVLGHSMGGKVAMRFAQLHPGAVSKLVVVDISPRGYPPRFHTVMDAMLALELTGFHRRDEVDQSLAAAVPNRIARQFLVKNLGRNGAGRLFWKPNLATIRANYEKVRAALPVAATVACPTLFLRGGDSDYIQNEDRRLIHEMFSQATIKTIPGASHWVQADQPEEVAASVTEFLSRDL